MLNQSVNKEDYIKDCNVKASVVVTGRNYCNMLTMSRALGRAGYDVEVLRVFKSKPSYINLLRRMKPEAYSRYVKVYKECIADDNPKQVIKELMDMADAGQKKLLIPVDDYLACTIDESLDTLSESYIIPNIANKAGQISKLMDKNEQKKLAEDFNLPMLHSVLIKSENGNFHIPDDVHYPCFVKPNVSMKSTKAKMVKCSDKNELHKVLTRYAANEDFEMLVEEFADIKAEYSILGVCTKDGIVAPGLFMVIEGGHRERKGVALMGELISTDPMETIIEECNKFIKSLNYTGMFDVDLIENKEGQVYFVELNFRAGASMQALTDAGVNLAGMFADSMLKGVPVDENSKVSITGRRFISEKVLMEEYARSDADKSKIKQSMADADVYFIKDDNDPAPYKYFKKFYFAAGLMRIPYRLRDKLKNK